MNLAHVYFNLGMYVNAIKMYQNCSKKFFYNKDTTLLLFIARAFFETGKLEDCKDVLQKAIHIAPQNKALWFHLAQTMEQYSIESLRKEKRASELSIFKHLVEQPGGHSKAAYLASKAEKHVSYCVVGMIRK